MSKTEHRIFDDRPCLTREELTGYAAGTLTEKQRHHVERHVLECELCAEALDGVQSMADPARLAAHVAGANEPGRAVKNPVPFWRRPAMAVAAVLSIFMLSSVYLAFFRQADRQTELVTNTVLDTPQVELPVRQPEIPGMDENAVAAQSRPVEPPVSDRLKALKEEAPEAPEISESAQSRGSGTVASGMELFADEVAVAEEVTVAEADEEMEAISGSVPPATRRLPDFYDVRTARQKNAVYIDQYKISPNYVLTDIEASPMNSYVAIEKESKTAKPKKRTEAVRATHEVSSRDAAVVESQKDRGYNKSLQTIFSLLDSGAYGSAYEKISEFIMSYPGDANGRYYRGYTLFMLERDREAMVDFEWILARPASLFSDDASWHKALILARQGKPGEARPLVWQLAHSDGPYMEHARSLLEVLRDE